MYCFRFEYLFSVSLSLIGYLLHKFELERRWKHIVQWVHWWCGQSLGNRTLLAKLLSNFQMHICFWFLRLLVTLYCRTVPKKKCSLGCLLLNLLGFFPFFMLKIMALGGLLFISSVGLVTNRYMVISQSIPRLTTIFIFYFWDYMVLVLCVKSYAVILESLIYNLNIRLKQVIWPTLNLRVNCTDLPWGSV